MVPLADPDTPGVVMVSARSIFPLTPISAGPYNCTAEAALVNEFQLTVYCQVFVLVLYVPVRFPVAVVFTEGFCCAPLEGPVVLYTSAFALLLSSFEQDTVI